MSKKQDEKQPTTADAADEKKGPKKTAYRLKKAYKEVISPSLKLKKGQTVELTDAEAAKHEDVLEVAKGAS